jgi:hypothetical protein
MRHAEVVRDALPTYLVGVILRQGLEFFAGLAQQVRLLRIFALELSG